MLTFVNEGNGRYVARIEGHGLYVVQRRRSTFHGATLTSWDLRFRPPSSGEYTVATTLTTVGRLKDAKRLADIHRTKEIAA